MTDQPCTHVMRLAVNGRIDWWRVKVRYHNGLPYARRVTPDGKVTSKARHEDATRAIALPGKLSHEDARELARAYEVAKAV